MAPALDTPSSYASALASMSAGAFLSRHVHGDLVEAAALAAGAIAAGDDPDQSDSTAGRVSRLAATFSDGPTFDAAMAACEAEADWAGHVTEVVFAALVAADSGRVALDPDSPARLPEVIAMKGVLPDADFAPAPAFGP